jgi:hypothetical protein
MLPNPDIKRIQSPRTILLYQMFQQYPLSI